MSNVAILSLSNDAEAKAIGEFLLYVTDYTDTYKIGTDKKLQAIIGKDKFYPNAAGQWAWGMEAIKNMIKDPAEHDKIKTALNVMADARISAIEKKKVKAEKAIQSAL